MAVMLTEELATRFPEITFEDGPPMAYVDLADKRYVYDTLTQIGLRLEGAEPYAAEPELTVAWEKFWPVLEQYLSERKAKKVLWRVPPHALVRDEDGASYIRTRLAVVEKLDG